VYCFWFFKVLKQIKLLRGSALGLRSEHRKILWQALYFILSMLCFFVVRLLVLMKTINTEFELYLAENFSLVVIDLFPVGYMVYCHRRMFSREAISYNFSGDSIMKGHNSKHARESARLLD
jgi:hypothetical protein